MEGKPLVDEMYREYECDGSTYRISDPVTLFVGTSTHRVLDREGVVHCVSFPACAGKPVVLRWKPRDASNPVQF